VGVIKAKTSGKTAKNWKTNPAWGGGFSSLRKNKEHEENTVYEKKKNLNMRHCRGTMGKGTLREERMTAIKQLRNDRGHRPNSQTKTRLGSQKRCHATAPEKKHNHPTKGRATNPQLGN